MQTKSKDDLQHIILDTCILNYTSNKYLGTQLSNYLYQLTQQNFNLAIYESTHNKI